MERRERMFLIAATPEWKAAVQQLADLDRSPSISAFIDRAIQHYAQANGWPTPPVRLPPKRGRPPKN